MTGAQFERLFIEHLKDSGYWALRIPCNDRGAQPFDVIAIRGSNILAVDCKVCSQPRFETRRIEDNQRLAFELMQKRTNAWCGFACYHDGNIFMIPFGDCTGASVRLETLRPKYFYWRL